MSQHETKKIARSEHAEPSAVRDPVPIWLVLVFGGLAYWGLLFFSNHGGGFDKQVYAPFESYADVDAHNPKSEGDQIMIMGGEVFNKTCAACHQPGGVGKDGTAPPLVGSEWVLADGPNRIAHVVLNGLTGTMHVKDKDWNLTMVPWKDVYDDKHIAAVLTYVRNSWGNKASIVKPEDIAAARKDVHPGPETMAELQAMPVK